MNVKVILLILLYIFCQKNLQAQKNLVENAGFEDELEGWTVYGAQTTAWVVKKGKVACAIAAFDDTKWLGTHQIINLPKNTEALEVSLWIKPEAIQVGNEAWKKGIVNVDILVTEEIKAGNGTQIATVEGTSDWSYKVKYILVPKAAKKCKISIAMGYATGTLFVDEISCKAITKAEYDKHNVNTDEVEVVKPINFLLQTVADKKVLVVKDASTEENTALVFSTISKEKEKQEWKVHNLLNGYYKIICVNSKKAITQIGETFTQKNWMGDDEQQWKITKTTKGFSIVNKVTNKLLKIENNEEWVIEGFIL